MKYRTSAPNLNYLFWATLVLLAVGILALVRFRPVGSLGPGPLISIISIAISGVSLIIFYIQFIRARQIQEAVNIKNFLTEFQKDETLYSAFFDLVYGYTDSFYEDVEEAAQEYIKQHSQPPARIKPVFDCFAHLQKHTEPGRRLYHPLFFQFSPEEKKLDSLLDYFNAVGFYLYKRQVKMEDVVALLGDYLAVLADRKVINVYLDLCNDPTQWKYDDTVGATPAYLHLSYLIESYKKYNFLPYKEKREVKLQRTIERLKEENERKRLEAEKAQKKDGRRTDD